MLYRFFGSFGVQVIEEDKINEIDNEKIEITQRGFQSEVGRKGYEFNSHSSTTWLTYAKDLSDDSCNIVRFEPRYLEQSPPLVPDVGILENVFNTRIEDAKKGSTLVYYPGDYTENPYEWSEKEVQNEVKGHLVKFSEEIKSNRNHFLKGKNLHKSIENGSTNVYAIFGDFRVRRRWSMIMIASKIDVLSLRENSEEAYQWHLSNNTEYGVRHPSEWDASKVCSECKRESMHRRVNYRDRSGNYGRNMFECENCRQITKIEM